MEEVGSMRELKEALSRLSTLEKRAERTIQLGTVTALDETKQTARVKFQDTGICSDWLYIIQHVRKPSCNNPDCHCTECGRWLPKINDTVLVLYLPIRDGDGFILGGV